MFEKAQRVTLAATAGCLTASIVNDRMIVALSSNPGEMVQFKVFSLPVAVDRIVCLGCNPLICIEADNGDVWMLHNGKWKHCYNVLEVVRKAAK